MQRQSSPNQEQVTANAAWSIVNHLVAGMVAYAALGWAIGTFWLGNASTFTAIGAIFGLFAGLYLSLFRLRQLDSSATAELDPSRRTV